MTGIPFPSVDGDLADELAEIRFQILRLLWRDAVPRGEQRVVQTLHRVPPVVKDVVCDIQTIRLVLLSRFADRIFVPVPEHSDYGSIVQVFPPSEMKRPFTPIPDKNRV